MNGMFADCLSGGSVSITDDSFLEPNNINPGLILEPKSGDEHIDVALKNLVGDGAIDVAERWADNGRMRKKLKIARRWLTGNTRALVDELLGPSDDEGNNTCPTPTTRGPILNPYGPDCSDDETDFGASDDERGRTAHILFSALSGIPYEEMPLSSRPRLTDSDMEVDVEQAGLEAHGPTSPLVKRPRRNRLTPESSPVRQFRPKMQNKGKNRAFPHPSASPKPSHHLKTPSVPIASSSKPSGLLDSAWIRDPRAETIRNTKLVVPPLTDVNNILFGTTDIPSEDLPMQVVKKRKINVSTFASVFPPTVPMALPRKNPEQGENIDVVKARTAPLDGDQHLPTLPENFNQASGSTRDHTSKAVLDSASTKRTRSRSRRDPKVQSERQKIASRLIRARPDLAAAGVHARQNVQTTAARGGLVIPNISPSELSTVQHDKKEVRSFETVDEDGDGLDWDRSRELVEMFTAEVVNGQKVVLPRLMCLESQSLGS